MALAPTRLAEDFDLARRDLARGRRGNGRGNGSGQRHRFIACDRLGCRNCRRFHRPAFVPDFAAAFTPDFTAACPTVPAATSPTTSTTVRYRIPILLRCSRLHQLVRCAAIPCGIGPLFPQG